jgi:O-antigen ligase
MMLLSLFVEAGVVGIICIIFLILFVVAGIRQMMKEDAE